MRDFFCPYGRWIDNVREGDYTIWPFRGVEIRYKDGPDDPFPVVNLVLDGVIGPPVGPDKDGKPELKGVKDDKWKTCEVKGVFVGSREAATASNNVN